MALAFLREQRQKAAVDSLNWPSSWAIAFAVVACSVSLAKSAGAEEPVREVVRDSHVYPESNVRYRLMSLGAGITLGSYGLALGTYFLAPNEPGAGQLRVPFAGPWLALAETGCPAGNPDCPIAPVVIRAVLTGIDGLLQLSGLAVIAEGLFMPVGPGPRNERKAQTKASRNSAKQGWVRPVPFVAGRDGFGLGFAGSF